MKDLKSKYVEQGFVLLKQFIDPQIVSEILWQSKDVFVHQFKYKGYTHCSTSKELSHSDFDQMLFKLFEDDFQTFSNCGKQIQHLIALHRLSLSESIIELVTQLGVLQPVISTRPVLFFNHPNLAKEKIYYKVDAHQDWRSMQGSLNSIVIWIPLIPINKSLGALEILPGSHKQGLMTNNVDHGFGMVALDKEQNKQLITAEVEVGDILAFSSFMVHQSGENISNTPRWSCHFRYNDLSEQSFIARGYPHPYLYKPMEELITQNFPTQSEVNSFFDSL